MNELAISALRRKSERLEALDEPTHRKMMDLFRKYLLVGGLPDAVNAFLETKIYLLSAKYKVRFTITTPLTLLSTIPSGS